MSAPKASPPPPPDNSSTGSKPSRLPWLILGLWVVWVVFVFWMGRAEWGVRRDGGHASPSAADSKQHEPAKP